MLINSCAIRRINAFIIDFIIVAFIAAIFSDFAIINPYYDEYYEVFESYNEFVNNSFDFNNEDYLNEIKNYTYDISRYGVYFTIISCVVCILYYTICQYFTGGKTLGKSIFKIKIVGKNNKKPNFFQIIVRTLMVNSIFVYLISIFSIFLLSKNNCFIVLSFVEVIDYLILFLSFIMIVFRKDGRGLHDIISGTKVVEEKCKQ